MCCEINIIDCLILLFQIYTLQGLQQWATRPINPQPTTCLCWHGTRLSSPYLLNEHHIRQTTRGLHFWQGTNWQYPVISTPTTSTWQCCHPWGCTTIPKSATGRLPFTANRLYIRANGSRKAAPQFTVCDFVTVTPYWGSNQRPKCNTRVAFTEEGESDCFTFPGSKPC